MHRLEVRPQGPGHHRPNSVLGSVLSVEPAKAEPAADAKAPGRRHDRRQPPPVDQEPARPGAASLRWPGRPTCRTATLPGPT